MSETPTGVSGPSAGVGDRPIDQEALGEQLRAERKLVKAILVGTLVGAVLGAGLWALIVTVALANDSYWRDIPPVLMGGGVGLLCGGFYGAWAGTVIGLEDLEAAEHHARRRLTP